MYQHSTLDFMRKMNIIHTLFLKHKYSQGQRLNAFSFILLHEANEDEKQPVLVYVRSSNLIPVVIFKIFV